MQAFARFFLQNICFSVFLPHAGYILRIYVQSCDHHWTISREHHISTPVTVQYRITDTISGIIVSYNLRLDQQVMVSQRTC